MFQTRAQHNRGKEKVVGKFQQWTQPQLNCSSENSFSRAPQLATKQRADFRKIGEGERADVYWLIITNNIKIAKRMRLPLRADSEHRGQDNVEFGTYAPTNVRTIPSTKFINHGWNACDVVVVACRRVASYEWWNGVTRETRRDLRQCAPNCGFDMMLARACMRANGNTKVSIFQLNIYRNPGREVFGFGMCWRYCMRSVTQRKYVKGFMVLWKYFEEKNLQQCN